MLNLPTAVVIGMHRSGTSAVCQCLSELGWRGPSPDEAIHASDNPDHFESRRFVNHNEALLESVGGQWNYPPATIPDPSGLWMEQARNIMSEVFPGPGRLIKDPRLSFTFDAWNLPSDDTRIIFVVRHPADVAQSLARRDGFSIVQGLALWDFYNARAQRLLQGRDVNIVGFEALRSDPDATLDEMVRFMSLPDSPEIKTLVKAAASSIDHSIGGRRNNDSVASPVIDRWHRLASLTGHHASLKSEPDPPSSWADEVLALVRERDALAIENRALRRKPLKIAIAKTTALARRGLTSDRVPT